ncbi:MAG: hypothetical protein KAS49_00960 [Candidatus Cloacimonetes bacterium]|nr:hypothetical protein [Candidatus Cloacimonadota bacterium]
MKIMNSGKKEFLILNSIEEISENSIFTTAICEGRFILMEAFAQSAGIHVRKNLNFSKQAFLLSFQSLQSKPIVAKVKVEIHATCIAASQTTFQYKILAVNEQQNIATATLTISTIAFQNKVEAKQRSQFYRSYYEKLTANRK